jgi:nucleoside-diphosphate-sugar epimerase
MAFAMRSGCRCDYGGCSGEYCGLCLCERGLYDSVFPRQSFDCGVLYPMYLVTGGAGFIGSHIAEALVRDGVDVRVFDNLSTGTRDNLADCAGLPGRLEFVEGDLRNMEDLRRAVAGVEGVFHQAALRSVPRSVDDPLSSNDVNVTGTLQLLMACREAKTVRRVVYASSSSVYGNDPTLPKVESLTPRPVSPYAATKLMGEYYCQIYTHLYGLEGVSLRYFNVFGPRQSPESKYAAVVPRFLESFNVACGARYSVLDVAQAVGQGLGRQIQCEHQPTRAGDVRDTLADISQAEKVLGYRVKVDFQDGMRRTCAYFADHWPNKEPTGDAAQIGA